VSLGGVNFVENTVVIDTVVIDTVVIDTVVIDTVDATREIN
jgi:hypothetical protein